ncbi:MAG: MmcB family DNA repair protein [Alphaproteobacteria bacterium]
MDLDEELSFDVETPLRHEDDAEAVARGVCRLLGDMGYATLVEMPLGIGRRVDVIGLNRKGIFAVVEIKTSVADLRADRKWRDYLRFCDCLYFAVPNDFPQALLPEEAGVIVADRFGGAVLRRAPVQRMAPATRRAQTLRFARHAARRLCRVEDPPV